MKSIYRSSVLSHSVSHGFVHDFNRRAEQAYSKRYLKPKFGDPTILRGRGGMAQYARRPN